MRDLNFDLKRLQAAHDDGSHGTRTARSYALAQAADTLHELGFKGLRATGLRRKHVVALVREWKRQGRSIGTMNPSCAVKKLLVHQYVERFTRHPVTTFVRTRRRCARIKGSAGIPGVARPEGSGGWLRCTRAPEAVPGNATAVTGSTRFAGPPLALRPWRVTRRRRRRRGWP